MDAGRGQGPRHAASRGEGGGHGGGGHGRGVTAVGGGVTEEGGVRDELRCAPPQELGMTLDNSLVLTHKFYHFVLLGKNRHRAIRQGNMPSIRLCFQYCSLVSVSGVFE